MIMVFLDHTDYVDAVQWTEIGYDELCVKEATSVFVEGFWVKWT